MDARIILILFLQLTLVNDAFSSEAQLSKEEKVRNSVLEKVLQKQTEFYENRIEKIGHPQNNKLVAKSANFPNVSQFTLKNSSCFIKNGVLSEKKTWSLLDDIDDNVVEISNGQNNILHLRYANKSHLEVIDDTSSAIQILIELRSLETGTTYEIGKDTIRAVFASRGFVTYYGPDYIAKNGTGRLLIFKVDENSVSGSISVTFLFDKEKSTDEGGFTLEGDFELPLIDNADIVNLYAGIPMFPSQEEEWEHDYNDY